jgi:hypothetical protein
MIQQHHLSLPTGQDMTMDLMTQGMIAATDVIGTYLNQEKALHFIPRSSSMDILMASVITALPDEEVMLTKLRSIAPRIIAIEDLGRQLTKHTDRFETF